MTEEERDNRLEDLFRKKLEENELVPGSDLADLVMGRLGRREFFRFNLLRFNIYYLTAALAALTVAVLILIPGPGTTVETAGPGLPQETVTAVPANEKVPQAEVPAARDTLNKTDATSKLTKAPEGVATNGLSSESAPGRVTDREQVLTNSRPVAETVSVSTVSTVNVTGPSGSRVIAEVSSLAALAFETSVSSGCVPLHVSFACNAEEYNRISWSFGDGGTSSLKNPDYIFDIPGTYRVTLTVNDERGMSSSASTLIEVWNRPRASFEVRKDDPWDEGDRVVFVNMSEGAVEYLWDFGDGVFSTLSDPSYRYEHIRNYDVKLVVWAAEGCADSLTVSDLFTDRGMYIRFPNDFVPGTGGPTGGYYNARTDEESTVFHPVASGIAEYNLKIYSKAGLLVFESSDTELGWDGYYRGELCAPGVYVWKVRGAYRNGRTFIMAGDVTLLKY